MNTPEADTTEKYVEERQTYWLEEAKDRAAELGIEHPSYGFLLVLAGNLEAESRVRSESQ